MITEPKVKPFRFWSQKVLPLVYDDSLSYYEVLGKFAHKLNELISAFNEGAESIIQDYIMSLITKAQYNSSLEQIVLNNEEE